MRVVTPAIMFLALLSEHHSVLADENKQVNLHRFYVLMAEVQNLKDKSDSQFKLAIEFVKASPNAANSFAEFWWSWGLRDCMPSLQQRIEFVSRLTDKAESKKQGDKLTE